MATRLHRASFDGVFTEQSGLTRSAVVRPDSTTADASSFLFAEKLPEATSFDAPAAAAAKLQLLLKYLERGEIPVKVNDLRRTLSYAAQVLKSCSTIINATRRRDSDGSVLSEPLSSVRDRVVREWLASTFTKQKSFSQAMARVKPPSFRNVATTLMIGKYIENIYKDRVQVKQLQYPEGVEQLFQTIDSWNFAIFEAETLTSHQPLRYIGHELFKRNNLFSEHKILPATLDAFLVQVERGYKSHHNSYHNETHGADVLQTVHSLLVSAQLDQLWLTSLEMLALLVAAAVHDVDHPGTTNSFQIKTMSDYAVCYNDRSVLENHHLHFAFQLLKNEEVNILQGLSPHEFAEVRTLVIDMVLATDMSSHFDHLKNMRLLLSTPDSVSQMSDEHRSKVLGLLLHTADISHPGKLWNIHHQWSQRITEEFFRQGDWEKELALPQSPMCNRDTTPLTESRLGFIDYIVSPLFDVCGDMLELLSTSVLPGNASYSRPWLVNLAHNRERWLRDNHTTDETPI